MPIQYRQRSDRKLTAMMVDDFIHDPILAAKVILGIKVPPHEELRLMLMWTTPFTIDDSGFSTGKSHNIAVISALRSILFPGRVSGIISKTFSQGKLIFQNFDRWYGTSAIFRNCVKHFNNKARLVHGNDVWQVFFRGGSEVRVLPPNFLQDAERLRSERWHDGYFDEWTTYGNYQAFNTTIMGRVSKDNMYPDDPIRMNHAHLTSTANFIHHPAYSIVRKYQHQIVQGNHDYARFSVNYRYVPDTPEYRWLINRRTIFNMQLTLPSGIAGAEIDGLWQKDSGSYYSFVSINNCRYSSLPISLKRTDDRDIYIAAFDVASGGGSSSHRSADSDDFAVSVLKLSDYNSKPQHCLTIRKNSIGAAGMSGILHRLNQLFRFSLLLYDTGGGGLFVRDELRKEEQLIENHNVKVTPIIEMLDTSGAIGTNILIPIRQSEYYINLLWGGMSSGSVLVNRMHNEMRGNLDNKNIILSGDWNGWPGDGSQWDVDNKREWLNRNTNLGELDRIKAEMDLAVHQLVMIDVKRNDNAQPILDSYGMYKFKSKEKKDSAYSLIYANTGVSIWRKLMEAGLADRSNEDGGGNLILEHGPI